MGLKTPKIFRNSCFKEFPDWFLRWGFGCGKKRKTSDKQNWGNDLNRVHFLDPFDSIFNQPTKQPTNKQTNQPTNTSWGCLCFRSQSATRMARHDDWWCLCVCVFLFKPPCVTSMGKNAALFSFEIDASWDEILADLDPQKIDWKNKGRQEVIQGDKYPTHGSWQIFVSPFYP